MPRSAVSFLVNGAVVFNTKGVLDMPLMIGVIFVSAVTILALNLLIDLTYSLIDPRIARVSSRMADVPVRRVA